MLDTEKSKCYNTKKLRYNLMENTTINQRCNNCKYFRQHYAISFSSFHTVCCGHCTNKELTPKEKRSFPFAHGCNMWESNEEEKARMAKSMEHSVEEMAERLNQILQILKLDRQ